MSELDGRKLKKLLDAGAIVPVDARKRTSFASESIPGALNLPLRSARLQAKRKLPGKSTRIAVYCQSFLCDSSEQLYTELKRQGYTKLSHFAGGIEEWKARGYPVRRKRRSKTPLKGKP